MNDQLTQNQELYVQARSRGLTQRQAYREAYPRSRNWKDSAVDSAASRLEANSKVSARLEALNKQSAKRSVISKAKLLNRLDNLAETANEAVVTDLGDGIKVLDKDAANILVKATKELLPYAEDEHSDESEFVRDFGLLIAPAFLEVHRIINDPATYKIIDLWLGGGRGSMKSSDASLEVVNYIERHPEQHAVVFMKQKINLRDGAYAQIVWAINKLGLADEYDMPDSTLRIRKKSTGQLILFRGVDNANKIKSIKVPFGHVGIAWFEEADQFSGMAEIRKVNQSVTRGGNDAIRIYTFNPPRSRRCWINQHIEVGLAEDARYFSSTYLEAPKEWLGEQFIADAEHLKEIDPQSYEHEYLGLPVGNGTEVFDRIVVREITDEEIRTFDNFRFGQDFGWYPDPWAAVGTEWRPNEHSIICFCEEGGNKLQPDEQAHRLIEMMTWSDEKDAKPVFHDEPIYSDDANPDKIDQQRIEGVDSRAAGKGNMRKKSYEFLQSCTIIIDPERCPRLYKELSEMQYEVKGDEVLNTIPDGNDHWVDSLRYAYMREARSRYAYTRE